MKTDCICLPHPEHGLEHSHLAVTPGGHNPTLEYSCTLLCPAELVDCAVLFFESYHLTTTTLPMRIRHDLALWCDVLRCHAELVDRAVLFFESLAASGSGSSRSAGSSAAGASAINPVYNLLPDCLSTMLKKDDPPLLEEQMQVIMTQLLGYVKVSSMGNHS